MARLDLVSVRKTARYQYCAILTRNGEWFEAWAVLGLIFNLQFV